ncbi:hypothetical protein EZV62_025389 [Acer yangbiense]|uniref:Uncharacterized protein n=1 Tax=Acer yangbiense TaxID=1000413 RepID=A0A5C7GXN4_9ROSI|nr:hypothetical protein EZV62_025389 [Acer yangbiense]
MSATANHETGAKVELSKAVRALVKSSIDWIMGSLTRGIDTYVITIGFGEACDCLSHENQKRAWPSK